MTKQHGIDCYVMCLLSSLMPWSIVPLYIAYSLQTANFLGEVWRWVFYPDSLI